jgi:hypothetical protein
MDCQKKEVNNNKKHVTSHHITSHEPKNIYIEERFSLEIFQDLQAKKREYIYIFFIREIRLYLRFRKI